MALGSLEEAYVRAMIRDRASLTNKLIQIVNMQTGETATGTTVMPADDTIPQNTEGDEYMTLAITPTNASNKLYIDVVFHILNTHTSAHTLLCALFQDSTANALASAMCTVVNQFYITNIQFTYVMTAGTTSETTFKVRAGCDAAGTTIFNGNSGGRVHGGVLSSSITIKEIKA